MAESISKSSKAQEYERFIKEDLLDKYTELIIKLQKNLQDNLIGAAVYGMEHSILGDSDSPLDTSNAHTMAQMGGVLGQVSQSPTTQNTPPIQTKPIAIQTNPIETQTKPIATQTNPIDSQKVQQQQKQPNRPGDRIPVHNVLSIINKIIKDFEMDWENFDKEFKKASGDLEKKQKGGSKENSQENDDYKILIKTLRETMENAKDNILKEIVQSKTEIKKHFEMSNSPETSRSTVIMCNSIVLDLFVRINGIYSGSLVKMMKSIDLNAFSLGGDRNLLREYLNEKIMDLPTLTNLSLKKFNKSLKEVNIMLNNLIPRTKSSLVKHTLFQKAGKYEIITLQNLNKYKRNDLNKLAKKIGLANVTKIKNKKFLIQRINTLMFFKAGGFRKREDLNVIASFLNINPKSYKIKKDLIRKVNKTIF